jgi:hypothetical protein
MSKKLLLASLMLISSHGLSAARQLPPTPIELAAIVLAVALAPAAETGTPLSNGAISERDAAVKAARRALRRELRAQQVENRGQGAPHAPKGHGTRHGGSSGR